MSEQNTRGGYSGSRGRSSRPNSGAFHHQRHGGVNMPFANDYFGSKDGMSQGRGKYSHNMSRGSGSKQFNGKPSSKYVYRQKSPATDVIPKSPEAGGSQLRQPECFVACGDGLHSFTAQSDSKNPTPDLIQNSPEAERSHMKQPESFSSPELVSGADLPILPVHFDSRNIHLNMTRMQIKETPEEETEETATVNNDFSFSGEVKDEWMGGEPLVPATHLNMTRMQIKETPEEETEETATVNNDFSFSGEVKDEWMGGEPLVPAIHLNMTRMQIKETPEEEREETAIVNNDFSFSGEVKDEWMGGEPLVPAKADIQEQAFQEKDVKNLAGIGGSGPSVQQAVMCPLDICPPKTGSSILLKPSLLVTNRHKRNQGKLAMEGQTGNVLRPGMVLLKNYLSISDQVKILKECRNLGLGPGGFYQPGYRDGAKLNLKMMCLGKNWDPEKSAYEDIRSIDGAKPPIIPGYFDLLVRKSIQDSHALIRRNSGAWNVETELPRMSPDICIVNFYTASGKLGLHQDRDESQDSLDKRLPVVSFSIGDTAEFLYGDERDVDKAQKVNLESGDVLVFGGKSRHIFHGVSTISTNTTPKTLQEETNIIPGRLNLTFRQY
ncbi:hypothetical protein Pint_29255 [Pistacia integerrima]|uniref:Uncharacterized protein n=1 Tax=Pistacia integerrima TaxID=434235 RepID=A0ACC0X0J9_9ROSI|nr:hypothetical protein Pint_29255 [Pistacia integerrima]